ncbi:Rv3654c family TadE-like protein [Corynebacterium marquesiae]|uniref:Rv3654c family TadE-like protein n=1 Tax=Corynebacterium marquesiae TaxID=2913503 RepID=UPI0038D00790
MSKPKHCGEEGYATIAAAGIIVAIVSLLLIVAAVGSRVAARHEAQVAADLAAVAGGWALATGEDACAAARDTAALNDAALETCTESGRDVIVTATVRGRSTQAKAGPV